MNHFSRYSGFRTLTQTLSTQLIYPTEGYADSSGKQGRCSVVITERREHLERLAELLAEGIKNLLIIFCDGMAKNNYRNLYEL